MGVDRTRAIRAFQRIENEQLSCGKIYLYGAGKRGEKTLRELSECAKIGGFIDGYKDGKIDGVKIYPLKEVANCLTEEDIILITASDTLAIEERLKERGVTNYLICNGDWCLPFYRSTNVEGKSVDTVEFYLVDAFEVFHFAPVIRFLQMHGVRAKLIAERPAINTAGEWFDFERAVKNIKAVGLPFCETCNPWARWAVTTQFARNLGKYFGMKINMAYGVTMLNNVFLTSRESCDGFDYKWVHGDFQKEKSSHYLASDKIFKIGYPKYDQVDKEEKSLIVNDNHNKKPILAYLPTWDEYSSIAAFYEQMKALRKDYYIICKMHHCTARLEEKRQDRLLLGTECDEVLEPEADLSQILNRADVIVADVKSGVASEVLYLSAKAHVVFLWPFEDIGKMEECVNPIAYELAPVLRPSDDIEEGIIREKISVSERKRKIEMLYEPAEKKPLESILKIFTHDFLVDADRAGDIQ